MTDVRLQANTHRLDWLQRIVVAAASGKRKPKANEIAAALNQGLGSVAHLEDPIEDFFCALAPTPDGDRLIFTGLWEHANEYLHTMLRAFQYLPNAPLKERALRTADALLLLSNEAARRAGLSGGMHYVGDPGGRIVLSESIGASRAARVRFTEQEITALGILPSDLDTFTLGAELLDAAGNFAPGDDPLDFRPLLRFGEDIILALPGSVSIAVRGLLMRVAIGGGMGEPFRRAIMFEQQKCSERTGFWPAPRLELGTGPAGLRGCVLQYGSGRYLHVIQVSADWSNFPEQGFASPRRMETDVANAIASDVVRFFAFLRERADYKEAMTVLLVGGWGCRFLLEVPIDFDAAPAGWRLLDVGFAEAAILGACEHGKLRDLRRVMEQVESLEAQGYELLNPNGILNLFGFWRQTDGNLLPEHWQDASPPCIVGLPTDSLFEPLREAATNRQLCSMLSPDGRHLLMQRVDWGEIYETLPIFGCLDEIEAGRLLGAVRFQITPIWVEGLTSDDIEFDWTFQVWKAALHWLAHIAPKLAQSHPNSIPRDPILLQLDITFSGLFRSDLTEPELDDNVVGTLHGVVEASSIVRIAIGEEWGRQLWRSENVAEASLATLMLAKISELSPSPLSALEAGAIVRRAIPSDDWRWLHAHPAERPPERLESVGLIDEFRHIPLSAVALSKTGHVWRFRNRDEGATITGEGACSDFLAQYVSHTLDELIQDIRRFDRKQLAEFCGRAYQASRGAHDNWHRTIRALRSISGESADRAAFERINAFNAVQRASKVVAEICACESPLEDAALVGPEELEVMFAKSMLLFANGQILSCIRAGVIRPEIRISPAGDLMCDRALLTEAFRPTAEMYSRRSLDEAGDSYVSRRTERDNPQPMDDGLRRALEAEYGVPPALLMQFPYSLVDFCRSEGKGVLMLTRAGLMRRLSQDEAFKGADVSKMLARLELPSRNGWQTEANISRRDLDLSRFDRPASLIVRPLLSLGGDKEDPVLMVAPTLVTDALLYALTGLLNGHQQQIWESAPARKYASQSANKAGSSFAKQVAQEFEKLGFEATCEVSVPNVLQEAVDGDLGDIDVFATRPRDGVVFAVEAKNLKFCRTDGEVAARMSEFRGTMRFNHGKEEPDRMLRHLWRVRYLREHTTKLQKALKFAAPPSIHGLVVVASPQPMTFQPVADPDGRVVMIEGLAGVVTSV